MLTDTVKPRALSLRALSLGALSLGPPSLALAQPTLTDRVIGPVSSVHEARFIYVLGVGTDACPDEDTFRSEVLARLGVDPFTATATTVIEASIERQGASFRGTIVRRDASGAVTGRRDLTQLRDCAAMVSRMAVSTSIALNPASPDSQRVPLPAAPSPGVVGPEGPRGPLGPQGPPGPAGTCSPCRQASESRARPKLRLGFGGFASLGSAPSLTGGLNLHADLRASEWSVGLGLRVDLPQSTEVPARRSPPIAEGTVLETRSVLGELSGCLHRRWFVGCGLLGAGGLLPSLSGATGPDTAIRVTVGLRAGAELSPWAGVAFRAWASVDVPLVPATVRVTGGASEPSVVVWRDGALAASAGLMALFAIP